MAAPVRFVKTSNNATADARTILKPMAGIGSLRWVCEDHGSTGAQNRCSGGAFAVPCRSPKPPVGRRGANRRNNCHIIANKMAGPGTEVTIRDVTALLIKWRGGDPAALERLLPLVHGELRRLAKQHMAGERPDHVLQAT